MLQYVPRTARYGREKKGHRLLTRDGKHTHKLVPNSEIRPKSNQRAMQTKRLPRLKEREREREREGGRHTGRQADRQIERQTVLIACLAAEANVWWSRMTSIVTLKAFARASCRLRSSFSLCRADERELTVL